MLNNFREWIANALPIIIQLTAFFAILVSMMIVLNRRRYQNRNHRWNQGLAEIARWVNDSIEFYSTHYAHLAAGAFTEDEVVHKLAQFAPTRRQAARLADRLADPGLNTYLEAFKQVESQIFKLAGERSKPDSQAYLELLGQLRSAGEGILEQVELLKN